MVDKCDICGHEFDEYEERFEVYQRAAYEYLDDATLIFVICKKCWLTKVKVDAGNT